MGKLKKNIWGSYKQDSEHGPESTGQRVIRKEDALSSVSVLQESLGWNYDALLTGIYFKVRGDIWQCVLKAELRSGPKMAFFTGDSLVELTETVYWYARKGLISWDHDKRPVRVAKRRGVHPSSYR